MDDALPEIPPAPQACPACGSPEAPIPTVPGIAECPACHHQFLPESADHDEIELSELRIRDISNLRRAMYRSRSWMIIGAGVCVVGALKLLQIAWTAARANLKLSAIGDALAALAAILIFLRLLRQVRDLTRQLRASLVPVPDSDQPPDFSALSNGSQRIADLEKLAGIEKADP